MQRCKATMKYGGYNAIQFNVMQSSLPASLLDINRQISKSTRRLQSASRETPSKTISPYGFGLLSCKVTSHRTQAQESWSRWSREEASGSREDDEHEGVQTLGEIPLLVLVTALLYSLNHEPRFVSTRGRCVALRCFDFAVGVLGGVEHHRNDVPPSGRRPPAQ